MNKLVKNKENMKLLLVEDDQAIAMGLEYSLEQENYQVTICNSVAAAMEAIASNQFDLALLDISLPDGNGFDVCKKLKIQGNTPVIFLTARDDEGSVVMGLDIGADDYITKPFRIRELQSRMRSVLRRSINNGELKELSYKYLIHAICDESAIIIREDEYSYYGDNYLLKVGNIEKI